MRNRVVDELRNAPDGLGVQELARRLGLHPNSVRWHLGALEQQGAVTSSPRPRAGRGRPQLVYRLRPAAFEGTRDEYRLLATILSSTVAATGASAQAERSGRAWGKYLVERPLPLVRESDEDAVAAVVDLLEATGFAPETADDAIRIRRCPFHDLAEAQPQVVCAVHRGLIDGAFEELGADRRVEDIEVFAERDVCVVRLSRRRSPRPSAPPAARRTA